MAKQVISLVGGAMGAPILNERLAGEAGILPGQEVNALVAAGATAIPDGAALESAGDGTLRVQTAAAATANTARDSVVAYAMEAVDNSGGGAAVRIKARVA